MPTISKDPCVILESARGFETLYLHDKLLNDNREIFFTNEVTAQSCSNLITQLIYLNRIEPDKTITLYLNSPGGSVIDGLAVYDVIRLLDAPVKTVCVGTCASMGAILFLAGTEREIIEHGRKKPHQIQLELDELNKWRESLAKIISERTERPLEEIYEATANDTYFNAEEAVKFGLATHIKKGGI